MSLSKLYTRIKLRSMIRELSKEVSEEAVQDPAVNEIIDLNTLDLSEMLNGATQPDYGETTTLADAATHYSETDVSATSYTDATKTVGKTTHGLTNADIGRRIILVSDAVGIAGISRIAGITSANAFTIEHSMGSSLGGGAASYFVLSRHSSAYLDLSAVKYDKLIKLVDSTNGLIPLKKAFEIENIINLSHNAVSEAYGYHEGERIYLVKGSGVTWGTLTLHYYRLPILPSADTDYIDLKDKYIRLLVDKCVIDVFGLAKLDAPTQMAQSVDNRTQAIRNLNTEKEVSLRTKQR